MYRINPKKHQWIIDLMFGIGFMSPLFLVLFDIVGDQGIYLTIGIGIGYILHTTQKMLVFKDMLDEAIEQKAEDKVESKAEDKVENKTEDVVETKVDQIIENKDEDEVEED